MKEEEKNRERRKGRDTRRKLEHNGVHMYELCMKKSNTATIHLSQDLYTYTRT